MTITSRSGGWCRCWCRSWWRGSRRRRVNTKNGTRASQLRWVGVAFHKVITLLAEALAPRILHSPVRNSILFACTNQQCRMINARIFWERTWVCSTVGNDPTLVHPMFSLRNPSIRNLGAIPEFLNLPWTSPDLLRSFLDSRNLPEQLFCRVRNRWKILRNSRV